MPPTRRELVGLLGTAVATGLAGCSSNAESQSPTPDDTDSTDDDEEQANPGDEDSSDETDSQSDDDGTDASEQTQDTDADWQLVDNPPALEDDISPEQLEKSSLTRAFGSIEAYTNALEDADAVDADAEYLQLLEDQSGVLVYHQGYGRNGCYDIALGSVDQTDGALDVTFETKDTSSKRAACTMAIVTPAKLLVVPMEAVPDSATVNGRSVSVEA